MSSIKPAIFCISSDFWALDTKYVEDANVGLEMNLIYLTCDTNLGDDSELIAGLGQIIHPPASGRSGVGLAPSATSRRAEISKHVTLQQLQQQTHLSCMF